MKEIPVKSNNFSRETIGKLEFIKDVDEQVYLDEYGCKDDCRDIQYTIDGEIVRKRDGYFRKVS